MPTICKCIALHAHHQAYSPLEFLDTTYEERLKVIENIKAKEELPWKIALRKRMFVEITPEQTPLWLLELKEEVNKMGKEWDQILDKASLKWGWWEKLNSTEKAKMYEVCQEIREQIEKRIKEKMEDILALHNTLCPCEWSPNNTNIFWFSPRILDRFSTDISKISV
jgi:hypothetical protein